MVLLFLFENNLISNFRFSPSLLQYMIGKTFPNVSTGTGAWPQKNSACLGIGAEASTSLKSRSAVEDFSQMARHMPCLPNLLFKKSS